MNLTELKGRWGEFAATIILRLKGYRIIAKRYKTKCGEIDIIAYKQDTIVFIEVKARKTIEKCFIAINYHQMQRLQRASMIFLKNHPNYSMKFTRYDVILIANWHLPQHIENVTA